jgi:hypothetical protein
VEYTTHCYVPKHSQCFLNKKFFAWTCGREIPEQEKSLHRQGTDYVHFLDSLSQSYPKQLFHNISIIKITNTYYQGTVVCRYLTVKQKS